LNDGGIVICSNERDLLSQFCKAMEDFDVDLLSSYGLTTFDMLAHNVKNWWQTGRLKRTAQRGKPNVLLAMCGRLPADLRVACSEFVRSKANDFSSIVLERLGVERQQIDHFEIVTKLSEHSSLENLVNYTIRDTEFISKLLRQLQILPLTLSKLRSAIVPL
jgi:DNA polymerase elongation subunit (family B)